jgi:hypothetical protein
MIRTGIDALTAGWPGRREPARRDARGEFSSNTRFVTLRKGKIRGQNGRAERAPIGRLGGPRLRLEIG